MELPKLGRKGNIGAVFIVLSTVIAVMIGILIYSNVSASIDQTSMTADENATLTDVRDYSLTAFGLVAVGLLVLGAVVIIGYLMKMRG